LVSCFKPSDIPAACNDLVTRMGRATGISHCSSLRS
jgi:hypothetical protein